MSTYQRIYCKDPQASFNRRRAEAVARANELGMRVEVDEPNGQFRARATDKDAVEVEIWASPAGGYCESGPTIGSYISLRGQAHCLLFLPKRAKS